MPNVSSTVQFALSTLITGSPTVGASQASLNLTPGVALGTGTAAGQADTAWWTQSTLVASASETWDFAGTLRDQLNNLVTFARVKALVVIANSGNTNNVVIGGGATTISTLFGATTHTTAVRPGGFVAWCAGLNDATGYVITSGTADLLQIANSGAGSSVTYQIAAIGASA
jgi:hypothetical protein